MDGFINDENRSVGRLYPVYSEVSGYLNEMIDSTGAVIMGRRVYDGMADPFEWATDRYEFQTPIFVLTHTPPPSYPKGNDNLSFTFVTDGIESAVSQAKSAAGDRDVQVLGASTTQQCINAGLCDELRMRVMSVLLGNGLRLLENLDTDHIRLERTKVDVATLMRTVIAFEVTKAD